MSHKKFLDFNGKSIYFLSVDGTYWVALKPICDALSVNWNRQFQNLQEDEILASAFAKQQMQIGEDDQLRTFVCLPEKYVYGWLFGVRSESAELKQYKMTCYDLLYDYFHGAITQRLTLLREKTIQEIKIERLQSKLKQTDLYREIEELKKQNALEKKRLTKLDHRAIQQMDIFEDEA